MTGWDEVPAEVRALYWKCLENVGASERKSLGAVIGHRYANGERREFRSLAGLKLGQVRRNNPDPKWMFSDRAAYEAHVRAEFPGAVETRLLVTGDDAEVFAVLNEHAPHLLSEETFVPDEVFADALRQSRDTGQPAGPGIEYVEPEGPLVVSPDKGAVEHVARAAARQLLAVYDPRALPAVDTTADDPERKAS